MLVQIVVFALIGSVVSLGFAALVLALPDRMLRVVVPCLINYAIGTLLGAAMLGLIPSALDALPTHSVMVSLLAGLVAFYMLEALLILRHCHDHDCPSHSVAGPMILIGDALHNFVDGIVMAVAFLSSEPVGVTTALAIVTHEVPQETGDFAILLRAGYTKRRALLFNLLSSLSTLVGALLTYHARDALRDILPHTMALAAASFLYIAMADLIPMMHASRPRGGLARQLGLVLAGIGTIVLLHGHSH